jgi:hypothetical protein
MIRIQHDIAWQMTLRILQLFNLRDEEKQEAFPLVYERVKEGLIAYEKERINLLHRLKPFTN